jgi:hypothetical protein
MSRLRSDRYCQWCCKRMRRAERIEIGISASTGVIACCSQRCLLAFNLKREPTETEIGWLRGRGGR